MSRLSFSKISLALALLAAPAAHADSPAAPGTETAAPKVSDPKALAVADHVMQFLGGTKRWNDLPGIQWTFGVEQNDTVRASRRHCWDKHSGWHRVEGVSRSGDKYVIIHKVGTTEGRAWMNGKPIEGDSLQKLIQRGHALWTNDTYWMLMPYKMRDPGVILAYDSQKQMDGKTYDVVSMTFDHVGLTPGDHYWVYVNHETGCPERWEMVLQSEKPPPVAYTWADWVQKDGLWFPTAHRGAEHLNVFTRDVETVKSFPPTEFTAP